MQKKKFARDMKKKYPLLLLALPGIILVFLFNYLPLTGLVIAFKDVDYSKGIFQSDWVGFENFKFFFQSNDAIRVTRNTLMMNALFIIFTTLISVSVAILLYYVGRRMLRVTQTILFLPYLISWIVASYALEAFIDARYGVINQFLEMLGMPTVNFYYQPGYWIVIITICYIWKSAGYYSILYYTRLIGIDPTLYEAAEIDGASTWQKIRYITLYMLRPLIIMLCIIQVGNIFYSDFGMYYFLTRDNGMLYPVTDVIDTYIFRALKTINDPGMGAAVGLFQSVMGFLLVVGANTLARKVDEEGAIF
ncbi:MAG: ABC transporter permease subunit [Eubacteriales bacterium]|nr:ABC transporter permease subunit [Eubacteriales bacterium]